MAWIKLEHATPDKPEVALLARKLGVSHEAAFVNLVRVLSGCGLTRASSRSPSPSGGDASGRGPVVSRLSSLREVRSRRRCFG